ncbi:MAG: STAS domain-containing protein [Isosphaeraceae bacterium]
MSCMTLSRVLRDSVEGVTVVTFAETSLLAEHLVRDASAESVLIGVPALSEVLVDLSGVETVSSSLLVGLFRLSRRVSAVGGRIKLCCMTPHLIEFFRLTCFDRFFQLQDEEGRILNSF